MQGMMTMDDDDDDDDDDYSVIMINPHYNKLSPLLID